MPTRAERKIDERLIRELRNKGVLLDAEGHKLDSPKGAILVTCADCDQFEDIFNHTLEMLRKGGYEERPQPLSQHGGGMLISETCPLDRKYKIDEYLLLNIARARHMKAINTLALLVHYPCGAARLAGIPLFDVIEHNVAAKRRVKSLWPELKVGCFVHVDYLDRKRTYFLSHDAFTEWALEYGEEFRTQAHAPDNSCEPEGLIIFPSFSTVPP
jgi:hypothetical protein